MKKEIKELPRSEALENNSQLEGLGIFSERKEE